MKALCISDVHAKIGFLEVFRNFLIAEKPDLILFTGDIVNGGHETDYLEKFDKIIKELEVPLFWVPGNNDIGPVYELMRKRKYSVEGKMLEYEDEKIIGMNGVPDLWGHGISYPKVKDKDLLNSIFLSHIPPKNFKNFQRHDHNSFDKTVELKNAPKIQICGHQHSYWGVGYIGKTKILKLPAGLSLMAAVLDTKSLKVEFIDLSNYNKLNKIVLR
ncbi:MAG: metallophosphoesterase [Candidatus Berkelbacteria bacterium]